MEVILRHNSSHNGAGKDSALEKLRQIISKTDRKWVFYSLIGTILFLPSIALTLLVVLVFSNSTLSPSSDALAWAISSFGIGVAALLPAAIFVMLIRFAGRIIGQTTWVQVEIVEADLLAESRNRREEALRMEFRLPDTLSLDKDE